MTINTIGNRIAHSGNGTTTVFSYPYRFIADADLVVVSTVNATEVSTTLVLGTNYTVSGAGAANGGSVTITVAPASGVTITIHQDPNATQLSDFINNEVPPGENVESAFDKLTIIAQRLRSLADRSFRLLDSDNTSSGNMFIQSPLNRASKVLGFGAGPLALPTLYPLEDLFTATGTDLVVFNLSALKALSPGEHNTVMVLGYTSAGDGGGLLFRWDAASTEADNGGTIAIPNSAPANGRWKALYNGTLDVKWFGAKGDGITDDTVQIAAAIDALPSQGGTVYLPTGTYRTTSQLTIDNNRVHFRGDGNWATRILFDPSANSTCLQIGSVSQVTYQGSVVGITFYSNNSTNTKVAIDILDTSTYELHDIVIAGSVASGSTSFWGGAGSIGIRTRGRETCRISKVSIAAFRPIVISGNPNASIDIDHFHFHDCYLLADGNPVVEIDSGVNLSQVTFDGYQAWVLGTDGLRWVDTTTAQVSNGLSLNNVRFENGSSPTAYAVRIEHNTNLQNFSMQNCYTDPNRRGIFLRKVVDVDLENHYHIAANEALNIDSTVARVSIQGSFWQAGCTASITGQQLAWRSSVFANAAVAGNAIYDTPSNSKGIVIGDAISEETLTINNAAVASLGPTPWGCLVVTTNQGHMGIFQMHGNNNTVTEALDPSSVFSATAGTATSTNVYYSGANSRYEIQNNRGGPTINYKVTHLGSKVNF